ncbi:MmgE/PrpD family protein [Ancylobacter sp. VNQ12]|uniref:MmgE/PrpD family protein n=1 Tax=Ancylobacter sp. VNQ12 TaxID=3400920 RepID=UPI003C07123E
MADETNRLATYVAELSFEELPAEVVARTERLILDFVGNVARGGAEADSSPSVLAMLARLGLDGPGDCTVIGSPRSYSPSVAALLNGTFGHSLDFDDTHAASSLHPSAPVVSAALAAAEMTGTSGPQFVTAVIAGYEVCCRLGLALDPTKHYARGFHPTATAGTFGAAAAAGKLLGLDAAGIACAFGIAASQAAGSLQFLMNGAWNKRYQVGASAMNGLIAATLALEGFKGAADAIEGVHGFLKGYSDDANPEAAVRDLGTVYETLKIGLKPYPSCRYTHAALDGLIALRAEHALSAADIRNVRIGLHPNGITLTGAPLAEKRRARTVVAGQFSMPFTAALALDQGSFGWDDYARLGDPALEALCDRIEVVADPRVEGKAHPFGAVIRVATLAGTFERTIDDPSGEPDHFPSDTLLVGKFTTLAEPVIGENTARLAAAVLGVSSHTCIDTLARLARPAPTP